MRKFIEEHELEVLLIFITMLGVTRWWIPAVATFENTYCASHWALSYDYGLVRRGLIGSIVNIWLPVVTIADIRLIALIAFCLFLGMLLIVFYHFLKRKESGGRLFKLILFFITIPATLPIYARDLGRFDLFLVIILFLCITLLSIKKFVWLIPVLTAAAMFIHEGFMVLCAPTIMATMLFMYLTEQKERKILTAFVVSLISVGGAFLILYKLGNPTMEFDEFVRLIQSSAAFQVTELSMRECYYSVNDHVGLAASSLYDSGSLANFFMAVLILSPALLILFSLWTRAFKNCGKHHLVCRLLFLATLSGLLLMPIATDYGRWLAAVMFCNFFAIFFLVSRDIIKIEELVEYTGGNFSVLFVGILIFYLLFGPLHDWEPYPYMDNMFITSISVISVLLFDIGFILRWRSLRKIV